MSSTCLPMWAAKCHTMFSSRAISSYFIPSSFSSKIQAEAVMWDTQFHSKHDNHTDRKEDSLKLAGDSPRIQFPPFYFPKSDHQSAHTVWWTDELMHRELSTPFVLIQTVITQTHDTNNKRRSVLLSSHTGWVSASLAVLHLTFWSAWSQTNRQTTFYGARKSFGQSSYCWSHKLEEKKWRRCLFCMQKVPHLAMKLDRFNEVS